MSPQISLGQSAGIVVSFVFLATWTTLSNKAVLHTFLLSSNVLYLAQSVATVVMLQAACAVGLLPWEVVSIRNQTASKILIAVSYSANVAFGLCSLAYVSIPMYGALKRLTLFFCWAGELFFERSSTTFQVVPSLLLIVFGAFVAGWNDLEFNFAGYAFGLLSCAGQGLAFVLSKSLSKEEEKTEKTDEKTGDANKLHIVLSVVHSNAVVSAVLMFVVVTVQTHWDRTQLFHGVDTSGVLSGRMQVFLNVVSVLLLNIAIFLDCTLNTPLTHAVAGNFKAGLTTVVGLIVFRTQTTPLGVVGLVLSFFGGVHYSIVKLSNKSKAGDEVKEKENEDPAAGCEEDDTTELVPQRRASFSCPSEEHASDIGTPASLSLKAKEGGQ